MLHFEISTLVSVLSAEKQLSSRCHFIHTRLGVQSVRLPEQIQQVHNKHSWAAV